MTVPNITSPFMAYETLVPKCKRVVKRALASVGLREPERSYLQRHFVPGIFDRQLQRVGFHKTGFAFCTYGFSAARLEAFSLGLSRRLDRFKQSPIGRLGTNYIVRVRKAATLIERLELMKHAFLQLMRASGAFATFRLANRRKLLIVTYHRFSADRSYASTSATAFAEQVAYLRARYTIVPLSAVERYLKEGHPLPVASVGHHDRRRLPRCLRNSLSDSSAVCGTRDAVRRDRLHRSKGLAVDGQGALHDIWDDGEPPLRECRGIGD